MTFDPDKFLAETEPVETEESSFDPDKFLAETEELEDKPEISKTESTLRGAAQGATAGFGDELGSAVLSAPETIRGLLAQFAPGTPENVDKQLRDQGFTGDIEAPTINPIEKYKELRDTTRESDIAAEEANPKSFLAGEVVGGIAPALTSGGAAIMGTAGKTALKEGAKLAARKSGEEITKKLLQQKARNLALKSGAKAGGIMGAAYGAGQSEADLLEGDIAGLAQDTAIGGATGAVMGGAIPVLGEGIKKVAAPAMEGTKGVISGIKKGFNKVGDYAADESEFIKILMKSYNKQRGNKNKIIGEKAGIRALNDLEEVVRDIGLYKEELKGLGNKEIKKSLSSSGKYESSIKKLENLRDKLKSETLHEEDAKVLTFLEGKIKDIRKKGLKSGFEEELLDLPTELEVMKQLNVSREKDIIASQFLTPEEKATQKLIDKTAKSKSLEESVEPILVQKEFGNFGGAKRDVLQAIDVDQEGKAVAQELINPTEIGPITKELSPEGNQFLGYKRGLKEPKVQQVQPANIIDPEANYSAQDLIDVQRQLSRAVPEKTPKQAELGGAFKEFQDDVISQIPEEQGKLYKEGFGKHQLAGRIDETIGSDIGASAKGLKGASLAKEDKAIESARQGLFDVSGVGTKQVETAIPMREMLNDIKRIDPMIAESFKARMEDSSLRLLISKEAQNMGMSLKTIGFIEAMGVRLGQKLAVGSNMAGNVSKVITKAPSYVIDDLANRAERIGNPQISKLLKGVSGKNDRAKSALMFSIMQNPEMKKKIMKVVGVEDENKDEEN